MSELKEKGIVDNTDLYRLVIVCCHGIYKGDGSDHGSDESRWLLEPFQKGEAGTFVEHIRAAHRVLDEPGWDPEKTTLIFSGGPTKVTDPPTQLSEAESYRTISDALLRQVPDKRLPGALCDTYATDSFQNLLFPLLLWRSHNAQAALGQLVVVSHEFKRHRFLNLHLPALGFPVDWIQRHVAYVGRDPAKDAAGRAQIERGEKNACEKWAADPWGVRGELAGKRAGRRWSKGRRDDLARELEAALPGPGWSAMLRLVDTGDADLNVADIVLHEDGIYRGG